MRFFSVILIFIVCQSLASGQSSYYPVTIPYLSSTKISENFSDGLNGAFNPAIIPYIKGIEAGMYAEKKYLTDINLLVLSVCTSFSNNGIGLLFQHFGNTLYNERIFGLNYAKSFGRVNAGILIQNIRISISGSAAISNAGMPFAPNPLRAEPGQCPMAGTRSSRPGDAQDEVI